MEEIDMLIHAVEVDKPEGQRNKAILETFYSCGLRVSELVSLKISNLYFEQGFVKIEGKSNKERLVPISERAIKEIKTYLDWLSQGTKDCRKRAQDILFLTVVVKN
jgi:integrase/recombinase XerD